MRRLGTAVALLALTVFLAARGIDAEVYQGGEAREALVAREMLATGDWILPLWNGTVVPSKPPMFHWLIAAGSRLAGGDVTPRTLRAPSAVLAGVIVAMVYAAGVAWGGDLVGAAAGLVLATTPQFLREGGNGRVDMTLLAGIVAAQIALAAAWRRGGAAGLPGFALAVGLAWAMLAKGPVGPAVVGMTAVALAVSERDPRTLFRLVRPVPVLLFVALAGGWYWLAYLDRGMPFVAKQILSENGEALLGGTRIPYRSPLFFVGPLFLAGLPWTLLLPWAVAAAWRGTRERRQCLWWAGVVFLFFSAAPLKRVAYILPLRPALALLVGWWLADVIRRAAPAGRLVRVARGLASAAAVVAAGLGIAGEALARGVVPASLRALAARNDVDVDGIVRAAAAARIEVGLLAVIGCAAAIVTAQALGRARWSRAMLGAAALVAAAAVLAGDVVGPERAAQRSVQPFARAVAREVPPGERLGMVASSDVIPFLFYVERHVPLERPAGGTLGGGWHVLPAPRWERLRERTACTERLRGTLHSAHLEDLVLVRCEASDGQPAVEPSPRDDGDALDGDDES